MTAMTTTAAEVGVHKKRPSAADAKRLLVGRDARFAPQEGVAALESLAEENDADALCTLATLRGAGAWARSSLSACETSLGGFRNCRHQDGRFVRRSGQAGCAQRHGNRSLHHHRVGDAAQQERLCGAAPRGQLLVLTPNRELASNVRAGVSREPERWRKLRESVDLDEWVTPPPPVQVCESPRVWTAERFTTPELCEWLIFRGRDRFKPALMRDATTGVAEALDSRTCSDFVFDVVDGGLVMLLLRVKVSNVTGIPVPHMEPPQIFHYAVGQEIKPHYDYLFDGQTAYGADGTYTGDRLATFLLYLNDGYEGGELTFPYGDYRYKGSAGDGIFFASQRENKPDPKSLHGATPVTRGEKFILSQWIHNQPFAAS